MARNTASDDYAAAIMAARKYVQNESKIEDTKDKIRHGIPWDAEAQERRALYERRERRALVEDMKAGRRPLKTADIGLERTIGLSRDFLSIEFLEQGQAAARSVGRITVPDTGDVGTGFLIGEDLLLTNNHVLRHKDHTEYAEVEFDVEDNRFGPAKRIQTFSLDPNRFFFTDRDHDMTVIAVSPVSLSGTSLGEYGFHPLIVEEGKIRIGDPVMIIQHPKGGMKSLVLHDSHFLHLENQPGADLFCWYSSDTEKGSSGSPVFNSRWEVVALHHRSVPRLTANGEIADTDGNPITETEFGANTARIDWVANQGVRASRIVRRLTEQRFADPGFAQIRDALLAQWRRPGIQHEARTGLWITVRRDLCRRHKRKHADTP